jgi:epoxyqueuosine reductase
MPPGALPETGTDRDHAGTTDHRLQRLRPINTTRHELGPNSIDGADMCCARCHADQTCTDAQCRFGTECNRAGHALLSAHGKNMSKYPFIYITETGRKYRKDPRIQHFGISTEIREDRRRYIQRIELQLSATIHGIGGKQSTFPANETDRCIGLEDCSGRATEVGIETGRNIKRKLAAAMCIHALDKGRGDTVRRARHARSEHAIDDHIGLTKARFSVRDFDGATGFKPDGASASRIARRFRAKGQQPHIETRRSGQMGKEESIAAVVAVAGHDNDSLRIRPAFAHGRVCASSGATHQLGAGKFAGVNGCVIDSTHLLDAEKGSLDRYSSHGPDYTERFAATFDTRMLGGESATAFPNMASIEYAGLTARLRQWAGELGFQQLGIAGVDLSEDETHLLNWLDAGRHGEMDYMARHGSKRSRPGELVPGTLRVISVRMDYLPEGAREGWDVLADAERAYVARYALGRDYHKLMRNRLQTLARRISEEVGPFGYRAFVDSAPVLERALARNAGLGWIGKHSCLINRAAGSWFFIGELYTDLALPLDTPATEHCGTCRRCIDICPTQAIVAPYQVDARRCIAYLTIELRGSIPPDLRRPMGNRIFGCDDCQLICPWNKFASRSPEPDFRARHGLDDQGLIELFGWSEDEFLARTEGSPIRRTGHVGWLRNIAVALGNAAYSPATVAALQTRTTHPAELVREHVQWALQEQAARHPQDNPDH